MATECSPPDYTETHWCVFDPSTGEILGTETIWTEQGAGEYEPGPSAGVLRSLGTDDQGRSIEIDAIEVKDLPGPDYRVDVSSRTLAKRPDTEARDGLPPFVPPRL
ncbi:hypothetical protein JDV09_25730 [Mycobacterium sp. Y57]|uniref:hypothetical protein n=1 Tax=Mycolicibacterium xanthum TaxID=2796469 RepID=UPI001C84C2C7|nr:hypothetical protein [Mycolicibacterium xanthum]MBX7435468.1 hypothetical protein [Mycolicibacterium xanthum]